MKPDPSNKRPTINSMPRVVVVRPALLVLENGRAFRGRGFGAEGESVGELTMGPMTVPVARLSAAPPLSTSTGSVEAMAMYAGESARFVREVEPAVEIVRSIAVVQTAT